MRLEGWNGYNTLASVFLRLIDTRIFYVYNNIIKLREEIEMAKVSEIVRKIKKQTNCYLREFDS